MGPHISIKKCGTTLTKSTHSIALCPRPGGALPPSRLCSLPSTPSSPALPTSRSQAATGLARVSPALPSPASSTLASRFPGVRLTPPSPIGVWTTGVINVFRMLTYVVFQFLGAFVGALLLWGAVGTGGKKDPWNLGAAAEIREADLNNESYNEANAFVHSTLATFLLVLTYYVTVVVHNKTYNPVGPLMVGLVNWALF